MNAVATVGSKAPEFRAPSSRGQTLDRASFRGKVPVALVFLPMVADAPDALASLDDQLVEFGRRRVQVLVVDSAARGDIAAQVGAGGLSITVLADPDRAIRAAYGVGDALRVVVVDRAGSIVAHAADLELRRLPEELLALVDRLQDAHPESMTAADS